MMQQEDKYHSPWLFAQSYTFPYSSNCLIIFTDIKLLSAPAINHESLLTWRLSVCYLFISFYIQSLAKIT